MFGATLFSGSLVGGMPATGITIPVILPVAPLSMTPMAFALGKDDLAPAFVAVLSDALGPFALPLGSTANIHIRNRADNSVIVNAPVVIDPDQVGHKGRVIYLWQVGDSEVAGQFMVEIRVLLANILPVTWLNGPNKSLLTIAAELV